MQPSFQDRILASAVIGKLIETNKIPLERARKLTLLERRTLESTGVYELIDEKKLSVNQALALTTGQLINLDRLSLEQAVKLTVEERHNFESGMVIELIDTGRISLERALSITPEQRYKLDHGKVSEVTTVIDQLTEQESQRIYRL